MNAMTIRAYTGSVLFACALCACSGSAPPAAPGGATPARWQTSVAVRTAPWHADRRRSWISSELAHVKGSVLFVSDAGTADVYIYTLPALKVVGTITGFSQPQGECSDNKGNVWITDTNAQTIYQLSHHGRLENELSDSSGYPAACAWDATTGNLAVMNLFGTGSTNGAVLIYAHGSGSPVPYTNTGQYYYNFGGYDASGNLFFDGSDSSGNFMLAELPAGSKSASTIKLSGGTIYFPGMVQWDSAKHDLIVGDQSCGNAYVSCLYAVTVSQKTGTIGTQTNLQNSSGGQVCDLVQGVEFGSQIGGSDYDFCGSTPSATYLWPYPGGGSPSRSNTTTDSAPVGATISK